MRKLIILIAGIIIISAHIMSKDNFSNVSDPQGLPSRRLSWGFYQILWNPVQFERGIKKKLEMLGGKPEYVLFFRDLHRGRGFPSHIISICRRYNLTAVISFEPAPWGQTKTYPGLEEISAGEWGNYFAQYAKDAAKVKTTVIFRFGFEMNGDWFSWGHKPELFIKSWRRVHSIFQKHGAENIQWMFCPNIEWDEYKTLNSIDAYYPGDRFVDIVALDGYNFGDNYTEYHSWKSYHELFENSLSKAGKYGKPLMISEIGCAHDESRKPEWISSFLKTVTADTRVSGFIYYDYQAKRRGYPNWRLDSDRKTLEVFRFWANSQIQKQYM